MTAQETKDVITLLKTPNQLKSFATFLVVCLVLATNVSLGSEPITEEPAVFDVDSRSFEELLREAALDEANELSNRRRLTPFFPNEQSPFYGVQLNFVNVRKGNVTFVQRDLVRLDRVPIVFGRVYDSAKTEPTDFGPGWKLSITEFIEETEDGLRYMDASNSTYELNISHDSQVSSPHPHLTGISGGKVWKGKIELHVGELLKIFQRHGSGYRLESVTDKYENAITIHYAKGLVSAIHSSGGRFVKIYRDKGGLITSASDDIGREVKFIYDDERRMTGHSDISNGDWAYQYQEGGLLVNIIDSRKYSLFEASYNESGQTESIRVQHDSVSFRYLKTYTEAFNSFQKAAIFWHDESGLTAAVQDYGGNVSRISFDQQLRVSSLSFDGDDMASFGYNEAGQLVIVKSGRGVESQTSELTYDGEGRVIEIDTDGQRSNEFQYDRFGNVLSALYGDDLREYRFEPDGTIRSFASGETQLSFGADAIGRITQVTSDQANVKIRYSKRDNVDELSFEIGDLHVDNKYEYDMAGFRSSGKYSLEKDRQLQEMSIALEYDEVGNMRQTSIILGKEDPIINTYEVGEKNQLYTIRSSLGVNSTYEYDVAGRPTIAERAGRLVRFEHDNLGRLTKVTLDDLDALNHSYEPMEVDIATEADDRTLFTTIDAPVSSAIFGDLSAIAYVRPRGSAYGPIRFDATMARFIFSKHQITRPDAKVYDSLRRRLFLILVDEKMNLLPLRGFDKASNSLFLPPELVSVNCAFCIGWIDPFSSYGISVPSTVEVGSSATIYVDQGTNTSTCHWYNSSSLFFPLSWRPFLHNVNFGDGSSSSFLPLRFPTVFATSHLYNTPGDRTVRNDTVCSCSIFTLAQASATISVLECGIQRQAVAHSIDGCSIPAQVTQNILNLWGGSQNDPVGGDVGRHSTKFGEPQGTIPHNAIAQISSLPCNQHDLCYQTCGASRSQCDVALAEAALEVCASAYEPEPLVVCPHFDEPNGASLCAEWIVETLACPAVASLVGAAVVAGGASVFSQRQEQYCTCDAPPS